MKVGHVKYQVIGLKVFIIHSKKYYDLICYMSKTYRIIYSQKWVSDWNRNTKKLYLKWLIFIEFTFRPLEVIHIWISKTFRIFFGLKRVSEWNWITNQPMIWSNLTWPIYIDFIFLLLLKGGPNEGQIFVWVSVNAWHVWKLKIWKRFWLNWSLIE